MLKFTQLAMVTLGAMSLVACGDDDDETTNSSATGGPVEYELVISNLTNAQPLSAPTVLLHDSGEVFEIGKTATDALELLAESGDSSEIVEGSFVDSYSVDSGGLTYGATTTVTVSHTSAVTYLSLVSMLGNTNDAFTGLNKVDISALSINDSVKYSTVAYDAGTEANTEDADTVPGPAAGGEAYNAVRDDSANFVRMHSGIVSNDDGLTSSALTYQHKFDNPIMSVTITRIQ